MQYHFQVGQEQEVVVHQLNPTAGCTGPTGWPGVDVVCSFLFSDRHDAQGWIWRVHVWSRVDMVPRGGFGVFTVVLSSARCPGLGLVCSLLFSGQHDAQGWILVCSFVVWSQKQPRGGFGVFTSGPGST